jgi:hypothetical protein
MSQFIDFVSDLIYGNTFAPNHRQWEAANPTPTTTTVWIDHHLGNMLFRFEQWLASTNQPPVIPWDGSVVVTWETLATGFSPALALGPLDGSFTGIAMKVQLSRALHERFRSLGYRQNYNAGEFRDAVKAPFSHRYWSYLKWADMLVKRFDGQIVVPPAIMYDRDGTILSSYPFLAIFNELHWNFHDHDGHHGLNLPGINTSAAAQNTPKLDSTAGQARTAINTSHTGEGSEFFRFHRDHVGVIYNRWLKRKGLPGAPSYNFTNGWPVASGPTGTPDRTNVTDPGLPSTWVEPDNDPFINAENGDVDNNLRNSFSSPEAMGVSTALTSNHANGHNRNADITTPFQNNYCPRFYSWHEWLDLQWYFRAPRLGRWNASTRLKERVFEPVLSTGGAWPGLHAISIVRDPSGAADAIAPANAVNGINFNTGAGTLKLKTLAADSYNRVLRLTLQAEVYNDAVNPNTPVETVNVPATLIGPGQATALNTEFTIDIAFMSAFRSDSPAFNAATPVGFVNSRILIRATLAVDGGSDAGFVYTDRTEIFLVKEKQAPQIDLYFNHSTFSEDQVNTVMGASGALFTNALILTEQDRTSDDAPITWPAEVHPAVRGLIKGFVPSSGLFDAPAHAPVITFSIPGITAELVSGSPFKENPSLPDHLPQRYTYFYNIRFAPGFTGFSGIAAGGFQNVSLAARTYDRSNNQGTQTGSIRLLRDANPYMIDGDPPWLSIDTRVFRVLEGDMKFNATLTTGSPNPNAFIQAVVNNLRMNNTGGDTFDGLPVGSDQSALVFFPSVTNVGTGVTRRVFNFVLAKVRLRGVNGASNVRAFFRLFRYTASNLVFNGNTGYRTHNQGGINKIPLMGFENATPGGNAISVPFFAALRVNYNVGMQTQADSLNVQPFPAGNPNEQVMYFGAYLDINQDTVNSRLPLTFISALAEQNGFAAGDVTSIRNIFYDSHVCLAAEINQDGDPTQPGDDPFNSDNLAQRNLVILKSANPGDPITHQVQHSFEVFTGDRFKQFTRDIEQPVQPHHHVPEKFHDADNELQDQQLALADGFSPIFVTRDRLEAITATEIAAETLFMRRANIEQEGVEDQVRRRVAQQFPLVFDSTMWSNHDDVFDELLIRWNDLPKEARATIYFPGINCEHIVNLRNLRHAPGDVKIKDSHTLELTVGGVTYIPIPTGQNARVPGIITIDVQERVKSGQRWVIDVIQLRGEERRTTGAFQLEIMVTKAGLFAAEELETLKLMFDRLSLLPKTHPWRAVLEARVNHLRERSKALAEDSGDGEWIDPTVWYSPDDRERKHPHPITGSKVRVVLEKIRVRDDLDPLIKGRGELYFATKTYSPDNGGQLQQHRFPQTGVFKISDIPGRNDVELDSVIFEGYVENDLRIEIAGTELDTFDPDDVLGKYTRLFCGDPNRWYGAYGPDDEKPIEPENLTSWEIWYRIERS